MKRRVGWVIGMALALGVGGCVPPATTAPSTGQTSPIAGGVIKRFALPVGSPTRLDLGTAGRLFFALSAGETVPSAFQFRVQNQAIEPNESVFRSRQAELIAEPGALDWPRGRRVQAAQEQEKFWINIGDSTAAGDRLRTADLRVTTPHAYFYRDVAPNATLSDDQVRQLASAFEEKIYPTVTAMFGPDPATDPLGESRVYVVLSPAVDNFGQDRGLMGYFWSRDMLTPSGSGERLHSNQKKVIFLTSRIFEQKPYTTYGTLAHEFTHLVVFNQKVLLPTRPVPEATWLDEGWAMLSMDRCGYGLAAGNEQIAKDVKSFLDQPEVYSLTEWETNPRGFSYGQSYLFTRYLYDRFGPDFVRAVLSVGDSGVNSLQAALARKSLSFPEVFADWAVANAIQGLNLTDDSRFKYGSDINLRGTYGSVPLAGLKLAPLSEFPRSLPQAMRPWGTLYFDLVGAAPRAWNLEFQNTVNLFGSAVRIP